MKRKSTRRESRRDLLLAPRRRQAIAGALALSLSACGMPSHMRIENAHHPRYEDKDVRFRTTYYFRVFDYCAEASAKSKQPRTDTLYRFRMTGKANSLTNAVHFESGTLDAAQIDPLGATVAYDENNRQFYYKSPADTRQEAQYEQRLREINRLMALYQTLRAGQSPASATTTTTNVAKTASGETETTTTTRSGASTSVTKSTAPANSTSQTSTDMKSGTPATATTRTTTKSPTEAIVTETTTATPIDSGASGQGADARIREALLNLIVNRVDALRDPLVPDVPSDKSENNGTKNAGSGNGGSTSNDSSRNPGGSAPNSPAHVAGKNGMTSASFDASVDCKRLSRGFMILGPEGWRLFNQKERLLMAMSSSGRPLISTMQELSGRVLNNQPVEAEMLLPLVREDLRVTRAVRELEKLQASNPGEAVGLIEAAMRELSTGEGR